MIMNHPPMPEKLEAKKESSSNSIKISATSSRQWSCYRNPRIVRVSRTFGGKDRHSKVCTVRGLRDRRIRLSVPTAVVLYDLQDRLGLSQPSKVVDWLLDATKQDIDKLPPLPFIAGNFTSAFQPTIGMNNNTAKEVGSMLIKERESQKWINMPPHQDEANQEVFGQAGFVAQNFFPLNNQTSYPNMAAAPPPLPPNYSSCFHWDPSNLSLSQFGGGYCFSNINLPDQDHVQSAASSSINPHMYLPASMVPSFPSIMTHNSMETHDFRQMNQLQNSLVPPTTLHLIRNSPMKASFLSNLNSKLQIQTQEKE